MIKLNEEQLRAAQGIQHSSLIIANAGTGKTISIAAKIAEIQKRYPGKRILALSFTKKATRELAERIACPEGVTILNLSQMFYRILRANGYRSFSVLTDNRSRMTAMSLAIAQTGLTEEVTEQEVLDALDKNDTSGKNRMAIDAYFDILRKHRLMDFNCMGYFCLDLLRLKPAIAQQIQRTYPFVCLDEAQDLNEIQFQIITTLFPEGHNLTFTGDPKQAIYSFRGSKPQVLDALKKFYDADVYELNVNYRSVPEIVTIANGIVPGSSPMIAAVSSKGTRPSFITASTKEAEAEIIVKTIRERLKDGYKLSDMVILYRSFFAAASTVNALLENRIPFIKQGASTDRWQRHPYRELYDLLRLTGSSDAAMWKQCIAYFSIDKTLYQETKKAADNEGISLIEAFLQKPVLDSKTKESLREFTSINFKERNLRETLIHIWDSVLKTYFSADDDAILDEYLRSTERYRSLAELLDDIGHAKRLYNEMQKKLEAKDADYIRVESIHSSKGLQYPVVFLCGASDYILPDQSHTDAGLNIEEDRNLAYVACTRAQEQLYISYAANTGRNKEPVPPSRFFAQFFKATPLPQNV